MDFNSILIGSENAERLAEYYTKLLGAPAFSDGGYTAWQIGIGLGHRRPALRGQGQQQAPGRLIWNIESEDVKGDFERLKAAGAIVVREPYDFEEGTVHGADRHARRPRRQLLPAHEPDRDVGR